MHTQKMCYFTYHTIIYDAFSCISEFSEFKQQVKSRRFTVFFIGFSVTPQSVDDDFSADINQSIKNRMGTLNVNHGPCKVNLKRCLSFRTWLIFHALSRTEKPYATITVHHSFFSFVRCSKAAQRQTRDPFTLCNIRLYKNSKSGCGKKSIDAGLQRLEGNQCHPMSAKKSRTKQFSKT